MATLFHGDFWQGAKLALTGMLLSPNFLYQVEIGVERDGERLLSDFELATRLAYFLWDSTPDAELLAASARGELSARPAVQRARLLADDSRLGRGVRAFTEGMLALHRLETAPQANSAFPQATPALYAAMKEAVQLLSIDLAIQQRVSFLRIFEPGFAYVDATLAPFYRVSAPEIPQVSPPATGFSKLLLAQDAVRVGLLTEPAILAATSRATETSPTLRGIFVTELLCHETPPPPANVNANLPEPRLGVSRREQLESHISQPACAGCHQTIDPIGFGLEQFDALGQQQLDDNGAALSTRGSYFQTSFDGARELSRLVQADSRLAHCLARKAYMHGLARLPDADEDELIAPIAGAFVAGGHDLARLLGTVAESGMFQLAPEPRAP